MSSREREAPARPLLVGAALFAVYVIWGSTYYAMRVALRALPPFLMAGPRFMAAGVILILIQRARGKRLPSRAEWAGAALVGVLLLVFGNGLVAIAQRTVDSGVAATVVATMPLWIAILGSAFGERPTPREIVGLVGGFCGVALLHRGGSLAFGHVDSIVLLVAPVAWAFGSLASRRVKLPEGVMSTGAQMLAGGVVLTIASVVMGERPRGPITGETVAALLYLVFFGSLIAFTAYGFLLRTTRPAVATSYGYVNPVVALAIGSALGGEPLTVEKVGACVLTVAGVVVVTTRPRAR